MLLDYQIISSKFTSMANQADKLASSVQRAKENQQERFKEERSRASRQTASKAKKLTTVSQTVEFTETRAAKVSHQRAPFEPYVMTAGQQERYLTFKDTEQLRHEEDIDKHEQEGRRKHMNQLDKLIEDYTIDKLRTEIANDIEETKEEARYSVTAQQKQVQEVITLIDEMAQHHRDRLDLTAEDVITACFKEYGDHLAMLERKDVNALKKRAGELRSMHRNLERDLHDADRQRVGYLTERKKLLAAESNPKDRRHDDKLRVRCKALMDNLDRAKQARQDGAGDDFLTEIAEEMRQGSDTLFAENKKDVETLYSEATA